MCPLCEKYGTFIARCNALIEKVSPCIQVRFGNLEANDILVDEISEIEIVEEPATTSSSDILVDETSEIPGSVKNKYYAQYRLKFRPKVLKSFLPSDPAVALNYDVDAAEILIKHPLAHPKLGMIPEEAGNGNAQLKPVQARWKVAAYRTDGSGEEVEHGIERVVSEFQKEQPTKEVVSNGTTSRKEILQFPKWDTSIEEAYTDWIRDSGSQYNPHSYDGLVGVTKYRSTLVHKSGNLKVYPVSLAEPLKANSAADSVGSVTFSRRGPSALDDVAAGRRKIAEKGELALGEPVGCSLEKLVSMEIFWRSLEH
eukprot:SAG31_NODE_2815_length_5045_cov_3.196522_9_plen_312_part_00